MLTPHKNAPFRKNLQPFSLFFGRRFLRPLALVFPLRLARERAARTRPVRTGNALRGQPPRSGLATLTRGTPRTSRRRGGASVTVHAPLAEELCYNGGRFLQKERSRWSEQQ